MVAAVGTDFSDGKTTYGPDTIERGTLRRYLEPLEFDRIYGGWWGDVVREGAKDVVRRSAERYTAALRG